ncbi:MAG: hypothetical protein RJA36_3738 [Pseudomonadota bacterium]|jgi:hypothetical protein
MWAAIIVLAGDVSGLPLLSWHGTRNACLERLQLEAANAAYNRRPVAYAACEEHERPQIPRIRDMRIEVR